MLKFATAQIIAAALGDQQTRFTKAAHRAVFQYEARPGYLYVRSRAISSRCNDNFDEFPAEEIEKSYRTFVGKPVFVNHVNDNHRRARGVIIDAALHQDRNPDGSPDTWAEVLMEIDAIRFPKLAKAILDGHVDRTSMGCDVERSVCSACGNEARTPAEYCSHIPHLKGKRIFRATASGRKVGELVRETCFGLRFFENSVLVEPPADPTAHFLGVDSSGLGKAASKTAAIDYSAFEDNDGLETDDDGEDEAPKPKPAHPVSHAQPVVPPVPFDGTTDDRQRRQDAVRHTKPFTPLKPSLNTRKTASSEPKDQRFEGVGLKQDDDGWYVTTHRARSDSYGSPEQIPQSVVDKIESTGAAKKPSPEPELDEYGTPKPKRGQPYEPAGNHPWYKQVPLHHDHIVAHWDKATPEEKDAGMRWYSDAHHVAKAIARLDPRVKTDEEAAHKGAGVLSAYSPRTNWPMNMFNAAHSFHRQAAVRPLKDDPNKPAHAITMGMHADKAQRIMDGEHHQPVLNAPKTQDFAHLIEHGGYEPQTDEEKASGAERRLSGRVVIDRHALSVAAGRRITDVENDAHSGFPGASGKHARHYYEHAANTYRNAAAAISEREGKPIGAHQVQAVTWLVRQRLNGDEDAANARAVARSAGRGRRKSEENIRGHWKDFAGEHAPELKEQGNSHVARVIDATYINDDGTIWAVAYGEVKAPADVDTLREENCPVCGDKDTFDGIQCQICGFINPPEQFRDPDLDKAKTMDLRKQIVDPQLIDDNGDLQRVNDDGTGMPQDSGEPDDDQQEQTLDGQPLPQGDPQMADPEQLDENGLLPSPWGNQALDGTQQMGPAVSDRNGDGIIQPDEIDPEGNVNADPQLVDPGMGGQAAPRDLPGWAKDHTGLPFWPGPDMPLEPQEPEGPGTKLEESDNLNSRGMPMPVSVGEDLTQAAPGMQVPQELILAHPSDFVGDETDKPHWSWNRDVSDTAQMPQGPSGPQQQAEDEEEEDPRRRRMSSRRTAAVGQPADGTPDLICPHCSFAADATPPRTQDMANPQNAADGIVAGDVCPKCRKAQLLTPAELQGESSVPPPAVPQFPRT